MAQPTHITSVRTSERVIINGIDVPFLAWLDFHWNSLGKLKISDFQRKE